MANLTRAQALQAFEQALEEPIGLLLCATEPEAARHMLNNVRAKASDPRIKEVRVLQVNHPEGNLVLTHHHGP